MLQRWGDESGVCRASRGDSLSLETTRIYFVMKAEYDFLRMKGRTNPYASMLKRSVTLRLSEDVVSYFEAMAKQTGVPYQSLINVYLRDCLAQNRRLQIKWPTAA